MHLPATAFLVATSLHPHAPVHPSRCARRPQRPLTHRSAPTARRDAAGAEYIRLEAFLKLQGAADTGGQAKLLVAAGRVRVNGEVDTRRGRKLRHGDVVAFDGVEIPVDFSAEEGEEPRSV